MDRLSLAKLNAPFGRFRPFPSIDCTRNMVSAGNDCKLPRDPTIFLPALLSERNALAHLIRDSRSVDSHHRLVLLITRDIAPREEGAEKTREIVDIARAHSGVNYTSRTSHPTFTVGNSPRVNAFLSVTRPRRYRYRGLCPYPRLRANQFDVLTKFRAAIHRLRD